MPELVKGYYTKDGVTTEHDMYKGDLKDACEKWPGEWAKTPGKSAGSAKTAK